MTPLSNSADIFVQCTYPKFHHPMFLVQSYRVDKQTHKQMRLKTFNALRYATTLGKDVWHDRFVTTEKDTSQKP